MISSRKPIHVRLAWLMILCIASSVLSCAQANAATLAAEETIKVATFNCEFLIRSKVHIKFGLPFALTGADLTQWNLPGFRDQNFNEAAKAVAKVIHRIGADVIVLTEVGNDADVTELRNEITALGLTYNHMAVCDSADTTTGQHIAVLSKKPLSQIDKVIPGRESYDKELDDPEAEDDTGVSKGIKVVFQVGGQDIHLFGTHLASERMGHEQDAQRIAQASIVRRHCIKLLNDGKHVIVAGDLNDYRGQPALRRIQGRDDLWEDLIQTGGPTFSPKKDTETQEQYNARMREHWTYEFAGQRNQIDHILISQSVKSACKRSGISPQFLAVMETVGTSGHPASDHRALVLSMEFR